MTIMRKTLTGLIVFLVLLGLFAFWLLRGDTAQFALDKTTGPKPQLAESAPQWFPTVGIAKPIGWAGGATPVASEGLTVTVLPTSSIIRARSMCCPMAMCWPQKPTVRRSAARAVSRGWSWAIFSAAGAGDPSPNKIVVLRDNNGDGTS